MQRTRPFTTQRIYGMGFIVIVMAIILGIHSTFVFMIWGPQLWGPEAVSILFVYHIFFANLVFSFYQCIMTDPGVVPPNWGFYMGDETKRRRYCKMCNVWKPDRTHHCSICNRCILNMDHHCPWINNCVGYYNYKFFFLFITYALLILFWVSITSFVNFLRSVATEDVLEIGSDSFMIVFCWLYCTLFAVALGGFCTFHTYLLIQNFTTIELVEKKGSPARGKTYVHPWDLGATENIEECLGRNRMLWMIPTRIGMRGNGVRFKASAAYTLAMHHANDPQV